MSLTPVSITETETLVITRYEWATGAATVYREKAPPPEVALRLPLGRMHEIGAAEVQRLEADAVTNNDAEELTTAWDRVWASEVTA